MLSLAHRLVSPIVHAIMGPRFAASYLLFAHITFLPHALCGSTGAYNNLSGGGSRLSRFSPLLIFGECVSAVLTVGHQNLPRTGGGR